MRTCEHLSEGKCLAFTKIEGWKNHSNDIATHIPRFCAITESFVGDETNIKRRIEGKCVVKNDISAQKQCDSFEESEKSWKEGIPSNCQPSALY